MDPMEPGRVITILIVDDDDATLLLVSTFLRRNRYRVIAASNPIRALEILETEKVSLVITDLMMPHVDGIAFTEQVHELPGYAETPVIMLTAYGSDEVSDRSMRSGVAMTLAKPVQLSQLLDLVGFATADAPRG